MTRLLLLPLLALLGATALSLSPPSLAAQIPTVTDDGVENRFPDEIEFRVSARSDHPIEEIRLRYDFDSPAFVNRASASKEEIVRSSSNWYWATTIRSG